MQELLAALLLHVLLQLFGGPAGNVGLRKDVIGLPLDDEVEAAVRVVEPVDLLELAAGVVFLPLQPHLHAVFPDRERHPAIQVVLPVLRHGIVRALLARREGEHQHDRADQQVADPGDLRAKFEAFGFDACTVDGHDVEQIHKALSHGNDEKPVAVILDTLKGKGVKQVEETVLNHSMSVGPDVFDGWLQELKDKQAAMAAGR